jgi:DNA-binding MarR family transcriptional regulator
MESDNNSINSDYKKRHLQWRKHLQDMSGGVDIRGLEVASSIRILQRLLDQVVSQSSEFGELSGPRLGILLRLMGEEEQGNTAGISPTRLSHYQDVKKNTITALLKGLEEQGLIERLPDLSDRRGFLIRITASGRELVLSTAPARFKFMNELTSVLTSEECEQLLDLLGKLRVTLMQRVHHTPISESNIKGETN